MNERYKPEGSRLETPENRECTATLTGLEYAMNAGLILEGRAVKCDSRHDLIVDLGVCRGVIPREEAAYSTDGSDVRDIAVITRVGKSVCFKVTSVDRSSPEPLVLLSRREAQAQCYEAAVSRLTGGDVIDTRVTHIEPFGVFCDVGCGLVSLLPVDCISVSRISHPKERFSPGDFLKCVVRSNDRTTGRLFLSHKELLGTWEQNAALFHAGETAAGIIRSIEPYGIFVELSPNLAGLAEWCEGAESGHCAAVYIKSILPEKMKIKLVIVDNNFPCASLPGSKTPRYFIESEHIDVWQYSPDCCEKRIVTDFSSVS